MKYKKIYLDLMEYCRNTKPLERLISRNPKDDRIDKDSLYIEKHHIIPKHDGGSDNKDNLVELLPEEHYLAHLIRYRWRGERSDFLACRFMINGYKNKKSLTDIIPTRVTSKMIASLKQHTYRFRKEVGWQSTEGRLSISNSRSGTYPVKDFNTGEILGSFDKNHPKIIDGSWVHHSTNQTTGIDKEGNRVILPAGYFRDNLECDLYISSYAGSQTGSKNGNYKGIEEDLLYVISLIEYAVYENHLVKNKLIDELNDRYFIPRGFNKISEVWLKNHLGSMEDIVEKYNLLYNSNIEYNPYFRSKESRDKLRKKLIKYAWVCNNQEIIRIKLNELETYIKNGYRRGRK